MSTKPVWMIDAFSNKRIEFFQSVADATKYINAKSLNSILSCCNGKTRTAYGYKWKYATQNEIDQYNTKDGIVFKI